MSKFLLISTAGASSALANPPKELYHVLYGTSHLKGPCFQQDYVDLDFRRKGFVDGACPRRSTRSLSSGHETVCTGHSDENIKYPEQDDHVQHDRIRHSGV